MTGPAGETRLPTVAQVTPVYPPYGGGIGRVAYEYTRRLRAAGWPVRVFLPGPLPEETEADASLRPVRPLLRIGLGAFLPTLPFLLRSHPILHLHYPFFGAALPCALTPGSALVMTYHMDPLAPGLKGLIFRLLSGPALPLLVRRAERILVSSLDYARTSPLWKKAGAREKIEEHPLGVDLERFRPLPDRSAPPSPPSILFVGSLDRAHYFKGLDVLLQALSGLETPAWILQVVGTGDLLPRYRELARRLGVEERVRFLGRVPEEELPRLFRSSYLHCMPSTGRSEAFGLAALEAAASGIPSVASDLPGVRSVVARDETGLLAPPGEAGPLREALRSLLEDPEKAARMGRAARKRAEERFSWEKAAARLEALYREIISKRLGRRPSPGPPGNASPGPAS